jgi:hypothetical protein
MMYTTGLPPRSQPTAASSSSGADRIPERGGICAYRDLTAGRTAVMPGEGQVSRISPRTDDLPHLRTGRRP